MNIDQKIMLRTVKGYCFKPLSQILYLESCDKYVELHTTDGKQTTIFHSLKEIEERLSCGNYIGVMIFFRIHRKFVAAIHHANRWPKTNEIILHGEVSLPVGRTYSEGIRKKLIAPYG